jgi:hypothetical protein
MPDGSAHGAGSEAGNDFLAALTAVGRSCEPSGLSSGHNNALPSRQNKDSCFRGVSQNYDFVLAILILLC